MKDWEKLHDPYPNILYHYTSAEGLLGILSNKNFHLTDLRYVNDFSELQYSRELIESRLTARLEDSKVLSGAERQFINGNRHSFDPFQFSNAVYSMSFCEEGNLLSQWRGYRRGGGGYALGIDFFHALRLLDKPCSLRKIVYNRQDQLNYIDLLIDRFLTTLRAEFENDGQNQADDFMREMSEAFSRAVGELIFCFKHPDFVEEREWRLVHFARFKPTTDRNSQSPEFRTFEGNVIPYAIVSFDRAIEVSRDDSFGYGFPIVELMIGPTISAELNLDSVTALILSMNPDISPNIRQSGIPLRWL
ncbi:MAG: DUF2971 domain-containing protein [Gammaproteobacteria bacterium]|nr:DUF2971 domain-containing protein [Gammaproteobacteria bacterium]